jgi:hypothetical protein
METEKRAPYNGVNNIERNRLYGLIQNSPPKRWSWSATHDAYTGELNEFGKRLKREGKL